MKRRSETDKIDFVILWVDGNDQEWLKVKNQYKPGTLDDASTHRYRDWDNLQYWFRGVEKFAPWVNQIHFVTWGHLPPWLNTEHPKLNIVRHEDYIPLQYLPTFNSNAIELNLHRISNLAEHFVLFNDDMFLISETKSTDFFQNGYPRDSAVLSVHCYQQNMIESHIPISDIGIVNNHFIMCDVIKENVKKWFYPGYGVSLLLRSACLLPSPRFPGLWQHHLPSALCKSTFQEVWEAEADVLDKSCLHKFRQPDELSQWLMREWKICQGDFVPRKRNFGRSFHIDRKGIEIMPEIQKYIEKQKGHIVVINDGELNEDVFEQAKKCLCDSFDTILAEKSDYEL